MEEAEWFGLPVSKAITRYKCLWAKENIKKPMKYELTHKLIEELESKTIKISNIFYFNLFYLIFS